MKAVRTFSTIRPLGRNLLKPYTAVRFNSQNHSLYREKLEQRAKAEGLSSIEELREKYKDKIIEQNKVYDTQDPLKLSEDGPVGAKDRGKRPEADKYKQPDLKTLNTFVDLPKLSLHEPKEVELIWKARFADKERTVCGTLDEPTFRRVFRNARYNPRFVLPVPHEGQGAELHFLQWAVPGPHTLHCMFTSLLEYKTHQEYARPHTTIAIHSELLGEKKIALMNGEVDKDANVTHTQGAFLIANLQRFYGADDSTDSGARKLALLQAFTANDPAFSADALISEVETLE